MKRLLLALVLSMITGSAFAACPAIPLVIKDGNGTSQNMGTTTAADGTSCVSKVDADTSSQIHSDLTAAVPISKNGTNTAVTGATPGTSQTGTQVNVDTGLNAVANTALGTPTAYGTAPTGNAIGVNAAVTLLGNDPCASATKLSQPFSLTASAQLFAGTASKKTYVCAVNLVAGAAQNAALVEGTGSVCANNIFGLAGGTTAATGWNFSANGGIALGSGIGTVISPSADANGTAANVCLLLANAVQTSGTITYVQQ